MMNCVLTQHSTVTRSVAMSRSASAAEKRSMSTAGTPSIAGVK